MFIEPSSFNWPAGWRLSSLFLMRLYLVGRWRRNVLPGCESKADYRVAPWLSDLIFPQRLGSKAHVPCSNTGDQFKCIFFCVKSEGKRDILVARICIILYRAGPRDFPDRHDSQHRLFYLIFFFVCSLCCLHRRRMYGNRFRERSRCPMSVV